MPKQSAFDILAAAAAPFETDSRTESIPWDNPEAVKLISKFRKHKEEEKDAKAAKELVQAEIKPLAIEFWARSNRGLPTPINRLEIDGGSVSFADSYGTSKPALAVVATLPKALLRQVVDISIDGDLIPSQIAADFARDLIALRDKYKVGKAMKIEVRHAPSLTFATDRHQKLTPEQNLELENRGLGTRITIK